MALDFAAGCLGGCAGVLVGHPFDTVKVHIQTQNHKNPVYRGTFHCIKTIIAKDSFRGLYRGITSPIGGVAFVNAIVFGVYGNIQRQSADPNSLRSHFFAGCTAGLAQTVVCSPMELAKTRLQLQNNTSSGVKFKGPLQCLVHIHKKEGFRGIFRGVGITAARDVPGFASYFVSYELLTREYENPGVLYTLMAGGLAGVFSWVLTVPMDVIKSRLQADGMSAKRRYFGIKDCVLQSYKEEGISFLTRGLGSTLLRAFPMNAACFFVVSWILKHFGNTALEVDIEKSEPIPVFQTNFVNLIVVPTKNEENSIHKLQTMKSLLYTAAFSDAVCSADIFDLASHDSNGYDSDGYYSLNIEKVRDLPSITGAENVLWLSD